MLSFTRLTYCAPARFLPWQRKGGAPGSRSPEQNCMNAREILVAFQGWAGILSSHLTHQRSWATKVTARLF